MYLLIKQRLKCIFVLIGLTTGKFFHRKLVANYAAKSPFISPNGNPPLRLRIIGWRRSLVPSLPSRN